MLGRYAATKTEMTQIIGNLFANVEPPTNEEIENYKDYILVKGTTYKGNKGLIVLSLGDSFTFEGQQEDLRELRENIKKYGKFTG